MFPRLVELGPVTLHTYGLLLALAFLLALTLAARLAQKDAISKNHVWDLGFVIILSAILGSKLLLVVADGGGYLSRPSRLLSMEFWQAAGVFYGGLMGAVLGSALYRWKNREFPFWKFTDSAAPALALGQSVGRLGCFAAGCCYGKPGDLPWAVTFTNEYANRQVGVPLGIPLHPVQLYESAAMFTLFLLLLLVHKKRQFVTQVFFLYLICYGVFRFHLEYFRGDQDRGFFLDGLLSTSQLISLLVVPVGLVGYFYAYRRRQGHDD